ncbi:MFS transporter [Longispora albida]|uniref:MFS transporter n=1 Tax=Longispora albida TaxID=203523 RepID=UPI000365ACBD|nr:MFS transporter [Longispora albida]
MSTSATASVAPATARPYRGTLLVLLAATFMSVLDFFIVNVAVPSIQRDLKASAASIQFVVAGYALAYAAGLIIGGRLGDIFGRRRMFMTGMVLFTLSSAACGLAQDPGFLVGARVVQGLSGALMSPQVLSIITTTFDGEQRAKAFNVYGVVQGVSAVFGQLIGGLLIQADLFGSGWRACFLINVPIGIAALALAPRLIPESQAPGKPRLDFGGMILVTAALVAVVLPLIEGRQEGWPAWAWLLLAAALPLFAIFAVFENAYTRRGGFPLVDLGLFRERAFTAGLATQVVFYAGQASFFLLFAVYVQFGHNIGALGAGLIFVAIGAGYMATAMAARAVAMRLGRQVIALGGVLRVIGLALMLVTVSQIGTTGNIAWLLPALVIDGAGMGFAVAPLAQTVLSRLKPQHAGAASGVLTTSVWIGAALGVAVAGVIFYAHTDLARAFSDSLVYFLGVSALVVVLVQFLPKAPGGAK